MERHLHVVTDWVREIVRAFDYSPPLENPGYRRWEPERDLGLSEYEQRFKQWDQLFKSTFLTAR